MNHLSIAIILFLIGFFILYLIKPTIIYNRDGSLRQFGVGYRKKTVFPMWLIVFILSIFCYHGAFYVQHKFNVL
jgi:hypothetical protein